MLHISATARGENDTMRFLACLHAYTEKRLCKKKNCGSRSDCVQTRSIVQRRTAYKEDTITKKILLQRRYYYKEDTPTKKILLQRRYYYKEDTLTKKILLWNILFMAPRIKMIVIKTYFGAVVLKRCDVSTCYDRSWSRQRHA